jgi:hypothetical protein
LEVLSVGGPFGWRSSQLEVLSVGCPLGWFVPLEVAMPIHEIDVFLVKDCNPLKESSYSIDSYNSLDQRIDSGLNNIVEKDP